MVTQRQPRQRPFSRVVGLLIMIATKVPRKKFRKVAKTAQVSVQPSTLQNCLPIVELKLRILMKFSKPIQEKLLSRWFRS